jgi:hypothetical protein
MQAYGLSNFTDPAILFGGRSFHIQASIVPGIRYLHIR